MKLEVGKKYILSEDKVIITIICISNGECAAMYENGDLIILDIDYLEINAAEYKNLPEGYVYIIKQKTMRAEIYKNDEELKKWYHYTIMPDVVAKINLKDYYEGYGLEPEKEEEKWILNK